MLRKTSQMIEWITLMVKNPLITPLLISLAGGVAAVLVKGARGLGQILAIMLVAVVAGLWISPLVIMLAEHLLGNGFKPGTENSIVAVVAISSWNLLEALSDNHVAARLLKHIGNV